MVYPVRVVLAITSSAKENSVARAALGIWNFSRSSLLVGWFRFHGAAEIRLQHCLRKTYLYFSLLSLAQYMERVTLNPSLNKFLFVTWHTAQLSNPEQSNPLVGLPVGPLQDPPPQTYGVPFASFALERIFSPSELPSDGGGGDVFDLTQHWISLEPGQYPAWKDPPEQPLFLMLRQKPEEELTLQLMFTQH